MAHPIMVRTDEARWADHFDKASDSYSAAYGGPHPTAHSFRSRRAKVHELTGFGPLGKLLDVGGGSAVYFDEFKAQVESYELIDISPRMIELARAFEGGPVPLHCEVGSVYSLPYPDNYFDTVLGIGLLEYLDDPWKGLKEIMRVTKPGACIVVTFPNVKGVSRRLSKVIYRLFRRPSPFSSLEFSSAQVSQAAEQLGLEWVAINSYNAQVIPWPFTWHIKRVSYLAARFFEPILSWSGGLWGSGFNVQFRKPLVPGK